MKIQRYDEFSRILANLYARCSIINSFDERDVYHVESRESIQPLIEELEEIQQTNLTKDGNIRRQLLIPHVLENVQTLTLYRNTAYAGYTVEFDYIRDLVEGGQILGDMDPEQLSFWTDKLPELDPEASYRIRSASKDYRVLAYNSREAQPERFTLRKVGVICCGTVPDVRIQPPSPHDRIDRYHEIHLPLYIGKLYGWNVYHIMK